MGNPSYPKTAGAASGAKSSLAFSDRASLTRPKWSYLVRRRPVWCPTWIGALCMIGLLVSPVAWWYFCGESFLSTTYRQPAEVLVVEGWIGDAGVRAAAAEFRQHGYRYVVAAGGTMGERWDPGHWSYAEVAERELIRSGVPQEQIVFAPGGDVKSGRTYESAVSTRQALRVRGIRFKGVNVFTLGAHAARSRLVFAKVFGLKTRVGVVDWTPSDYEPGPWWRSSERAREVVAETAGYLFELVLNSGRSSNSTKILKETNRHQVGRVSADLPGLYAA